MTKKAIKAAMGMMLAAAIVGTTGCSKQKPAEPRAKTAVAAATEATTATATPAPTKKPAATATAAPTATSKPTAAEKAKATATPKPAETSKATATPTPTEKPKATATPKPTEKPAATATAKPAATATPKPTEKPKPTATPKPTAAAACAHDWQAVTTTVHHDAVYGTYNYYEPAKYEWREVTKEVEKPVYEYRTVCVYCGYQDPNPNQYKDCPSDNFLEHVGNCGYVMENGEMSGSNYTCKRFQVGTTTETATVTEKVCVREELRETRQYVEKEAYDETVTTGYKCSKCGATK